MAIDKLITRITTIPELKTIFSEILFNTTSKISKISKTSVINGVTYAIAKIAQKSIKDIAVIESQIFPELSSGQYLDNAAKLWTGESRKTSSQSSTYIRVNATPGTIYSPGVQKFISDSGIEFNITGEVIVSTLGYAYIGVRSVNSGVNSNVDALSINTINPTPIGHISCTNEYMSIGGRDDEGDSEFRERIVSFNHIFSRDTIGYITEILRSFDRDILRVFNSGITDNYEVKISVVRVNGSAYTDVELVGLQSFLIPYLSVSDSIGVFGSGIKLINSEWFYIGGSSGIDFRVDIQTNYDIDSVRRNIQISLTKFLDFTNSSSTKILWDDLLQVVKGVEGVIFVPVEHFNPKTDQLIPVNQLPRIKGFKMRDLNGNILFDSSGKVSPYFYQNI